MHQVGLLLRLHEVPFHCTQPAAAEGHTPSAGTALAAPWHSLALASGMARHGIALCRNSQVAIGRRHVRQKGHDGAAGWLAALWVPSEKVSVQELCVLFPCQG